ncbi:MAG: carboxypeptidase-like regulatory domain-containing protein [Flavobacteriaceae bacterium]
MLKITTIFFFVAFLLLSVNSTIHAQETEFLRGKLLDAQTQEPIPFATIRLKNRAVGVISNQDGGFRIPKKFEQMGDTVVISSMGYFKIELLLTKLSPVDINVLELKPGLFKLSETVVSAKKKRPLTARRIVRRAIRAIPENYPQKPFSTIGYYRDYQLEEQQYINLNEAILEVYDAGFSSVDSATTKVRLFEYKQNLEFERDTLADDPYNYQSLRKVVDNAYLSGHGGNEFTILRVHDAIRNYKVNSFDFINRLETDVLNHHSFNRVEDTYLENEALFVIKFRRNYRRYSAFGTFYISKEDYGIHKLEYAVFHRQYNKQSTIQKDNKLVFELVTEYRRARSKLFLNYISFHNSFLLNIPPIFVVEDLEIYPGQGVFVLNFNRAIDLESAENAAQYIIKFKKQLLQLEVVHFGKKELTLKPILEDKDFEELFEELDIAMEDQQRVYELISFDVRNLFDVEGNLINEWTTKDYNQFREFFVQRVNERRPAPRDTFLMKKYAPIFKDQPVLRPDNFEDFWMNTPLQSIGN